MPEPDDELKALFRRMSPEARKDFLKMMGITCSPEVDADKLQDRLALSIRLKHAVRKTSAN